MELTIFVLDAFTDALFKGNSAAVVPVAEWPADELMQKIAVENNLSETAFIRETGRNEYEIRWFSPLTEIDFCGHATLAASFVLFNHLGCRGELSYVTREVGILKVVQLGDGRIEMSFPNQAPERVYEVPEALLAGLSITPLEVWCNRQAYLVLLTCASQVRQIRYQSQRLKALAPFDVVVTAPADAQSEYDFVSRYFWPANGGDEDPVTGSIHASLAPFWAERLGKSALVAYQASVRGGVLYCQVVNDRVLVSGKAVLYLQGKIYL
jgi:PhzF family phenazine biosynthesis protein